jgi:hypothetical protein
MMAITKVYREDNRFVLADLVGRCSFRDDAEFMLVASKQEDCCLEYASERLLANRDFVQITLCCDMSICICYSRPEFQLNNLELVVKAIELFYVKYDVDEDWFQEELDLCSSVGPSSRRVGLAEEGLALA